ncbi:MAG: dCTP deaminase [Candidatus Helarchaeota archaeon]
MSVISKEILLQYLKKEDIKKRLIITPLLNPKKSLNACSVDVRLGTEFIAFKKQSFPILDFDKDPRERRKIIEKSQEKIVVKPGENFYLHPRHYVIGSTFEYIQIPDNLMCYVIGKSTWGRMGLIIATATKVDSGFKGVITLEILNQGEVPLALKPLMEIAQLVIHESKGTSTYDGVYDCSTSPNFPIFKDRFKDISHFKKS